MTIILKRAQTKMVDREFDVLIPVADDVNGVDWTIFRHLCPGGYCLAAADHLLIELAKLHDINFIYPHKE